MKQYTYIKCNEIENYSGWEIVQIIPGENIDYAILMKEDKPIQNYIKLDQATTYELLEELRKRLMDNNVAKDN